MGKIGRILRPHLTQKQRDVLQAVRNDVTKGRWRRGAYGENGRYCLTGLVNKYTNTYTSTYSRRDVAPGADNETRNAVLGALRAAIVRTPALYERIDMTGRYLDYFRDHPNDISIEKFNDDDATTRKDILHVIDIALGKKEES